MCTIQAGIAPVKGWLGMPLPKVRGRAAPLMPTSEASTSVRRRFSIAIEVAAGQHSARVLCALQIDGYSYFATSTRVCSVWRGAAPAA